MAGFVDQGVQVLQIVLPIEQFIRRRVVGPAGIGSGALALIFDHVNVAIVENLVDMAQVVLSQHTQGAAGFLLGFGKGERLPPPIREHWQALTGHMMLFLINSESSGQMICRN